jgi:hypothetical protein
MSQTAALNIAVSSGLSTGCTAKICGWRQNGSIAREITVRPPMERYCFGPPDPARSPRPAATMIAAVRLGVGIVICQGHPGGETGRWSGGAQPLSRCHMKTEGFPIAVRILLHCTCKIARTV